VKGSASIIGLPWPSKAALARSLPFVAFILLLALDPWLGKQISALPGLGDSRWSYGVRTLIAAVLLIGLWRHYRELAWAALPDLRTLLAAALAGLFVLAVWLLLDHGPFILGSGHAGFDPRGDSGEIDWRLAAMRLAGAALVVPLIEELFWRSFLLRWIDQSDFTQLDPAAVSLRAVAISSLAFGFEHSQWAAGIVAGVVYAWLYVRYRNLWAAVIAHATTNAGLGIWVLGTGAWHFW
jgi:uncharacterized protein